MSFERNLMSYIEQLCKKESVDVTLSLDTKLFEDRLINSMRIIDLMGFVERELGKEIPDDKLTMEHFQTPRAVIETFFLEKLPASTCTARASCG